MMRQNLRITVCLAAFAAVCRLTAAQTAPATDAPAPGAQALPAAPGQPEPAATAPDYLPSSLTYQITTLLEDPAVARSHWGIMVTNLDGSLIFGLNQAQLFQPASNAKLFTTAAALALLGPEREFTTRVEYGSRGDAARTVKGDVVIIGSGDGNLSNTDLPYRAAPKGKASASPPADPLRYLAEFADQIAASGVKRITGDIVGDDTVFPWEPYPQDWSIDDAVWGYGAPVSGLTIEDNQIHVVVRPGKSASDKPTVEWQAGMPAYYRADTAGLVTGPPRSGSHVQMERSIGSRVLRIYGSIAPDAPPDSEDIAIEDPAEFAAIAFKGLLEDRGIKVDGVARAKHRLINQGRGFLAESRQPLPNLPLQPIGPAINTLPTGNPACSDACPIILQHTSAPLREDVVFTNKVSQNLHAELFLHQLGKAYGQPYAAGNGGVDGSTAEGARVVRQFLVNAGLDPNDFAFVDGSGLSNHDLVTPRATAKLLQFAATQPWFAVWKASLPIGGEDGTLEGRFANPPFKNHIFAKTGTLGEARALSGYLDAASGRTIIFSVMVDNHPPGSAADREVMDKIVAAIQSAE